MDKYRNMIVLDFDGVLHSYTSGWQGADLIPDPPVAGAMKWIRQISKETDYEMGIYSARSSTDGGSEAIKDWLFGKLLTVCWSDDEAIEIADSIQILHEKPPQGFIFIDDRGFHFEGKFPTIKFLDTFKPWNKK